MEPLQRSSHRWPDPKKGPLRVWITTALIDGRPIPVGVEVWSVDPTEVMVGLGKGEGLIPRRAAVNLFGERRAKPKRPPKERGLQTKDLRLPLGRLVGDQMRKALDTAVWLTSPEMHKELGARHPLKKKSVQSAARQIIELAEGPDLPMNRPGRRPLPASLYRKVAEVYTDALRAGQKPLEAICDHPELKRERGPITKSQAAKWVHRCRQDPYNFLPATSRGVPRPYHEEKKR